MKFAVLSLNDIRERLGLLDLSNLYNNPVIGWDEPCRQHVPVDTGTRKSWCKFCDVDMVFEEGRFVVKETNHDF